MLCIHFSIIVGKEESYGMDSSTFSELKLRSPSFMSARKPTTLETISSQHDDRQMKLATQNNFSMTWVVRLLYIEYIECL